MYILHFIRTTFSQQFKQGKNIYGNLTHPKGKIHINYIDSIKTTFNIKILHSSRHLTFNI